MLFVLILIIIDLLLRELIQPHRPGRRDGVGTDEPARRRRIDAGTVFDEIDRGTKTVKLPPSSLK